jgi:hypothetical protein
MSKAKTALEPVCADAVFPALNGKGTAFYRAQDILDAERHPY